MPPIDYSKIPTADLEALQSGDLAKVSTATLEMLSAPAPTTPTELTAEEKFAAKNPNLYGVYGAGRELLRTGIETAGTTAGQAAGILVPMPGAAYVGGGVGYAASKRAAQGILGEPIDTSAGGIAADVALGSAQVGVGKLISAIPGIARLVAPKAAAIEATPLTAKLTDKAAETVMEKTLKVPPSSRIGGVTVNRQGAINTALEEGIPVTKGGLKRVQGLLDSLGDEMDAVVASNPNAPIRIDSVLGPVTELRDWASKTVNGAQFAKSIDRVVAGFKKQYGDEITVAQAQEIKQNTNAFLKRSYGELKPVTEEATKQIVRGLKDRIAQEIPEIAGVNARYGDLKNLERVLERAVNRTGNWDWFSLSAGMAGTIVGGTTGSVAKATEAVGLWRLLKSPAIQSHLAIMVKNAGKPREANAMANLIAVSIFNKMSPSEAQAATIEPDGQILDEKTAKQILKESGGDRTKARTKAKELGYAF